MTPDNMESNKPQNRHGADDLSGKTILITGGNAGLGEASVRALAARNAKKIFIAARNEDSAAAVAAAVREDYPAVDVAVLQLDLASFDSLKRCATEFNNSAERLDILMLNAGVSSLPPSLTKEGYEIQFGTNHMGHALLTQLVIQKMLAPEVIDPRIVIISSALAYRLSPSYGFAVDDATKREGPGANLARYSLSKLANCLFAIKLAEKYPGITTVSCHPGVVRTTIAQRGAETFFLKYVVGGMVWAFGTSTEQGARNQIWCATADRSEPDGPRSGRYYEPIGRDTTSKLNSYVEGGSADRLWDWTTQELEKHGTAGWPQSKPV